MDRKEQFWIECIKNLDDLKRQFIEKFNWDNPQIKEPHFDFNDDIRSKIRQAEILAEKDAFRIYYFSLKNVSNPEKELKTIERKILSFNEIKQDLDKLIFVFEHDNFNYLDFVRGEKIGSRIKIKIKRFSINPENKNRLRTPSERLAELKLEFPEYSHIKNKIEEAFSVEAVTDKFYKEYIEIFELLKKELIKQKVNVENEKVNESLRYFIHLILNRIMFIHFVQKRGCFGEDKNFLANFWDAYKEKFYGKNKFHQEWLNVLFFDSLSKSSWQFNEKPYLGEFNNILKYAPYLNGGLFETEELDKIGWLIPDELFDNIFEFFGRYNFTVTESTPFDIEIAIDPEMLGNIYEHLVSTEGIEEEQAKAGIFYTPKVEIDLMIRRASVEFLFNKTRINKEKIYKFIFPEAEEEIKDSFTQEEAEKVLKELEEILILDPACGSGHYLVVSEQILYELKEILWQKLNKPHLGKYEEKKKIIERNIYGADIKPWAVNIAKLRLWLDLFVDADDELLKNQHEPLLPNLNFKIRYGDSLVQRLGNKLIELRHIKSHFKTDLLKELIRRKKAVYENRIKSNEALIWEKKLLQNTLSDLIIEINQKIQNKNSEKHKLENPRPLKSLLGSTNEAKIDFKKIKEVEKEIQNLEKELTELKEFKEKLNNSKEEPPMIWDLAFAEVFQMKQGFDIVIANPPYVRQERIEDLSGFYNKNEYKEKLIEQTRLDWSYDYEGKIKSKSPIPEKFDRKCDLYVYFYLKGLKLLNPDGVLCYISSNSCLDVGFGRVLQEVLIKRCPIIAIYDNQVKRSFKHADVNTIIALIKAPKERDFDEEIKNNEVRFVMFKKPFEEVMFSEVFIDLEKDYDLKEFQEGKRRENETYRLHIVNQKDLWEFGKDEKTGQYTGNKWGGKYLRAPEIYWKILEKGKGKLVKLGDIAEVKRGFTTGANEFFYVEDVTDKIEDE